MATTQTKETGTQVDFMTGLELTNLQIYTYRDDVIGLLGYQGNPGVIDVATRDALLNGDISAVVNQLNGDGMQVKYVRISWNETFQNGVYYVTDFAIGAVVQIARDFNTGPAYMITALMAVPWLKAVDRLGFVWRSWKLLSQKRPEPYNHCVEETISQFIRVSSLSEASLPPLPDAATVKATVKSQGNFQNALGEFTTQLLDKGYSVTYPATDAYDIDICFEKSNVYVTHSGGPVGGYDTWNYDYKVHVRFWWEFTTEPEIATADAQRLFVITATFILALCVTIGAIIAGSIVAYNLTHSRSEYQKWSYVYNPNTGQWEWKATETGANEGPPDWWGYVVPVVALMGIGAGVYLVLPYFRKGDKR